MINKVRLFLKLNPTSILLLLEAFLYLGWARILKSIPFSKVAQSLGVPMQETAYEQHQSNIKVLKKISQAIDIMSRYTFWESKCLVKAIAGMKMLERRKIESTLYLGTAKEETGELIAHAWLRSGHYYITGLEGMKRFTVVGKFAKNIDNKDFKEAIKH